MSSCNSTPKGTECIADTTKLAAVCSPWQITEQPKVDCLVNRYQQETLNIAGVNLNIFKLLGLQEQTRLIDLVKNGTPISGGDDPLTPIANIFDTTVNKWRSLHTGEHVIISSYIGYDFGDIRLPNGRVRYGIEANVRHTISEIRIKQGRDRVNRVTKARVERSDDGIVWYGVAIVELPDNDQLNTVAFKRTVASRYWRIRPVAFGGTDCDHWIVQALELLDSIGSSLYNIQDPILMENRNRDYAKSAIVLKGYYDLQQANSDLTRFGIEVAITYQIKINFDSCVMLLGRPIIVGDIIELPNETQYTSTLAPVKKYLEVTDVTWDTTSFSPTWQPTMLLVTAMPALATQETQGIFGKLTSSIDSSGLSDNYDGNSIQYQDFADIDQSVQSESKTAVAELGSDEINTRRFFEDDEIAQADQVGLTGFKRLNFSTKALYVESAMPPNGEPYTEGPTFPTDPKDKEYHRLTYEGLSKDVPARLFRWSTKKNRWIFLEVDRRSAFNEQKPILREYLKSPNKHASKDIK